MDIAANGSKRRHRLRPAFEDWLRPAFAAVCAVIACGCADMCRAQSTPPAVLEDLVVTGERTGPGMWHVHQGAAHLWILGSLTPLPRGITWRAKQVEQVLDHADQVLVPKPVELGMIRAFWLLVTKRDLLLIHNGRKLKDVLPEDLYRRFAAQRAKVTSDSHKWERYRPIVASGFLQDAAFQRAGLSMRLDLGAAVRLLAQQRHVRVEEIKVAAVDDVLEALKTLPSATEDLCVEASLATLETGVPRLRARAQAWADGNIERLQNLPDPPEMNACRAALDAGASHEDLIALAARTWLGALEQHLRGAEVTVAVVNMDMLLEPDGVLDQLRAAGYEVDTR